MFQKTRLFATLTGVLAVNLLLALSAGAQEPSEAPREVKIRMALLDLSEVRAADQAFGADVYVIATWHDPDLAGESEEVRTLDLSDVWRPQLTIYNQRSVSQGMPEEVAVEPDGTVTYLQRYLGLFSVPMDLRDFPRDQQEFYVWLVSPVRSGLSVTLVPDESQVAFRSSDLSISDWNIGEPTLTAIPFQPAPGAASSPGIRLSVPGTRLQTYYTVQVVIPLVAIVLMAWSVFWIAPTVIPTRVGVLVTTMLTLIAYRFMLSNYVPRLSYLTRLDWFMAGATTLVVLSLFTMAACAFLVRKGREAAVDKIDGMGRVLYPVVFLVYSLFVLLR